MKNKKILLAIAAFIVAIILIYSLGGEDIVSYSSNLEQTRREKDRTFRNTQSSPLPDSIRIKFAGLKYYPVDIAYKVRAKLARFSEKETLQVPTSDGKRKTYLKYGYAEFKLNESLVKLLLLEPVDEDDTRLLIAFADATSTLETYGGGRYIDVDIPSGNTLTIDFNKAYNPFCAYNPEYSCPIPPRENILPIAVRAGEKDFKE